MAPPRPESPLEPLAASLTGDDTTLVDLVDSLLGKGVVVDGEVVLGLAGVDLIQLRLAAVLAAADRIRGGARPMAPDARDRAAEPRATDPQVTAAPAPPVSPDAGPLRLTDLPDPHEPQAPVRVRPAPAETSGGEPVTHQPAPRWNPDPEEVRKGVMKLVLALAELIKQLLERQAIRRMEAGTLSDEEAERLGTALSQIEATLREMADHAGLDPDDINLDLGPLGKLV